MKNCFLENRLAEAEQPVKNFMADLIEELGRKVSVSQDPKLSLRYFGVQLEIKLVSFDGDDQAK
ncbi:hypothetical protein [Vibrio pectenicida]|uniref:Uncharacterized protein n=1 Tax=Vibrio pectenicida TaxID=62763 RepID=A0A3R9G5G2_9VIBR|nr:hypothetical protein [Vibrio pectenicida]RSD32541.1 hypothetical protein EJA03_02935 [Vibrio pectenicida]